MPQSLTQIYLHIVFSTKDRKPFLTDNEFRGRTHAYLAGICKNLDCPSLIVGGVEDTFTCYVASGRPLKSRPYYAK